MVNGRTHHCEAPALLLATPQPSTGPVPPASPLILASSICCSFSLFPSWLLSCSDWLHIAPQKRSGGVSGRARVFSSFLTSSRLYPGRLVTLKMLLPYGPFFVPLDTCSRTLPLGLCTCCFLHAGLSFSMSACCWGPCFPCQCLRERPSHLLST